jgi:hypothetical protein
VEADARRAEAEVRKLEAEVKMRRLALQRSDASIREDPPPSSDRRSKRPRSEDWRSKLERLQTEETAQRDGVDSRMRATVQQLWNRARRQVHTILHLHRVSLPATTSRCRRSRSYWFYTSWMTSTTFCMGGGGT